MNPVISRVSPGSSTPTLSPCLTLIMEPAECMDTKMSTNYLHQGSKLDTTNVTLLCKNLEWFNGIKKS